MRVCLFNPGGMRPVLVPCSFCHCAPDRVFALTGLQGLMRFEKACFHFASEAVTDSLGQSCLAGSPQLHTMGIEVAGCHGRFPAGRGLSFKLTLCLSDLQCRACSVMFRQHPVNTRCRSRRRVRVWHPCLLYVFSLPFRL